MSYYKEINEMTNPVIIDTAIAEAQRERESLMFELGRNQRAIESYAERSYYADRKQEAERKVVELVGKLSENSIKIMELESLYTGWSRAFLVVNSNGHIHKSTSCSTCFDTTRFVWLTDISGKDELEIAELAGEKACTICYAHAPSTYFLRECQLEDPAVVKAREEREAAKAVREAKRLATGIWNADGSPLRIRNYIDSRYASEVKTERTAQTMVVDEMVSLAGWVKKISDERYPNAQAQVDFIESNIVEILSALATKRGTSVEEQREIAQAKADKKIQANAKELLKWLAQNPQYAK
jgi:hypothetical protein